MKAIKARRFGEGYRGRIAKYFNLKDDSTASYAVEILGGIVMYLSSLSLFGMGGGPMEIASECANASYVVPESVVTDDAFSYAFVTGLTTLLMGLFAKVPLVIGPGYPFGVSFRRLMCSAPTLGLDGGLAANLMVGIGFTLFVTIARSTNGFVAIPEDFRLGMAGGIAALVGMSSLVGATSFQNITDSSYATQSNFYSLALIQQAELIRVPTLSTIGVIILTASQVWFRKRVHLALGSLLTILVIALISCIIRASLNPSLYTNETEYVFRNGQVTTIPSFQMWNATNSIALFKYILTNVVEKLFDSFATVTAVALLLVVTNLGYHKQMFVSAMNDSEKISIALLVDGFANILFAPFLNTVLLTPYIQSIAGIVAGTRTGLGSCVAGLLYISTSPVIRYVTFIFSCESINPIIMYAAVFTIRSIQYLDFRRPVHFLASIVVLFAIPMSLEIGFSASISYVYLFSIWFITKWWICINPQMVVALGLSVSLVLARSTVADTCEKLGIGLAGISVACLMIGCILFAPPFRRGMTRLCGNKDRDRYFEEDAHCYLESPYGATPQSSSSRKRRNMFRVSNDRRSRPRAQSWFSWSQSGAGTEDDDDDDPRSTDIRSTGTDPFSPQNRLVRRGYSQPVMIGSTELSSFSPVRRRVPPVSFETPQDAPHESKEEDPTKEDTEDRDETEDEQDVRRVMDDHAVDTALGLV